MTDAQAVALIFSCSRFHNRKRPKGAYGIRRIEQLHSLMQDQARGIIFPELPPPLEHLPSLDVSVMRLRVRGNKERGQRPSIYYKEETYFGEVLSNCWNLIGQQITVHLGRRDARYLRLFKLDGTNLGVAAVRGRWRHSPHTVDQRILVNKFNRDGQVRLSYDEDPMAAHLNGIKQAMDKGKKLDREQLRAVAIHTEHEHVRNQHAQSVAAQAMEAAFSRAQQTTESLDESAEEDGPISLPGLMAFNRERT